MATFEELTALPDFERIVLIEIKVGAEVEGKTWTATGSGSYWCEFPANEYGEVIEVLENGNAYTKVSSVSECDSTVSSFYYDYSAGKLYVHTSGGDAPDTQVSGEYKYTIIAKFWACFTNIQADDSRIIFAPEGASHTVYYLPYLDASSLPSITQAVGDYYLGNAILQFGRLTFANDGWWYEKLEQWLWQNAPIRVKIGGKESAYSEFVTVFQGIVRNPQINDRSVTLETKDIRLTKFRRIPVYKFWRSNYPNLEEGAEGRVIPVPFGKLENITPVCIDTVNRKYKVSSYPIESIDAVYINGIPTTNYTADLANGEFTLNEDVTGHVTCDVKGVKCDLSTGAYSENIADILYFVLNTLNGIPSEEIDIASFNDLKSARTQKVAWYLDTEISTHDFIRLLQATGVFHLIPTSEGKFAVKYYQYGTGTAKRVNQEDIRALTVKYDTDRIFKKVVIKYGKDPTTGEWKRVEAEEKKVSYRYSDEDTLTVETALRDDAEAEALANFYLRLVKRHGKWIEGAFSISLFTAEPADKISVSKKIETIEGKEISVLQEEVYRILSIRKELSTGTVRITALRDIEATGAEHADVAHEDSHVDTHSDTPHTDIAHEDVSHLDSHADSHSDTHSDEAHEDTAHSDSHADAYTDYSDVPIHEDWYTDAHGDVLHSDSPHSDTHTDSYSDTHSDSSHADSPYEDVPHEDTHADEHSDVPHTDSQY